MVPESECGKSLTGKSAVQIILWGKAVSVRSTHDLATSAKRGNVQEGGDPSCSDGNARRTVVKALGHGTISPVQCMHDRFEGYRTGHVVTGVPGVLGEEQCDSCSARCQRTVDRFRRHKFAIARAGSLAGWSHDARPPSRKTRDRRFSVI